MTPEPREPFDIEKEAVNITQFLSQYFYAEGVKNLTVAIAAFGQKCQNSAIEDAAALVKDIHPIGLADVAADILALKTPPVAKGEK